MPHILIVCTANICRSPVVTALLKKYLLQEAPNDEWHVSSAGTWAGNGHPASGYSVELMAEQGLDISQHRSRPIDDDLLAETDLALCMELGHVEALQAEFKRHAHKIYLLTEMTGARYSISDPYGGPREEYERMVREVTGIIEAGLPNIVELARSSGRSVADPGAETR